MRTLVSGVVSPPEDSREPRWGELLTSTFFVVLGQSLVEPVKTKATRMSLRYRGGTHACSVCVGGVSIIRNLEFNYTYHDHTVLRGCICICMNSCM